MGWVHGRDKERCEILMGKSLGKGPFVKLRRRLENNIKGDFRDIGCEDGTWMELFEDRIEWQNLMLAVLNLRVCYQSVNV
jgi:hypothetical protein